MFDKLNLYRPVYYILMVTGAVAAVLAFFVDPRVGLLIGGIWLASVVYALVRGFLISRDNKRFFQVIRESVFSARQDSIGEFAMPTVIAREDGEVLWTNDAYRHKVSGGRDNFCENLFTLIPGADPSVAASAEGQNVVVDGRMYSLYLARTTRGAETLLAAYLVDDHDLKTYTKEYFDSRPSVMILVIDNYSELFQDAKENERSRVVGEIEHIIETFAEDNKGLLKKLDKDRYLAIIEDRYMRGIVADRFGVLDRIREITTTENVPVTMSIGVGSKEGSLQESEDLARQALDMALGRGGDQAALKVKDGYEFYGGVSKGIEKRNKVRTRIVANAIGEIVESSGTILIMGHRFADLDCLGAAVGLCQSLRGMGKAPKIVLDTGRSLAQSLYEMLLREGYGDMFLAPGEALALPLADALLFVVDTHVKSLLESEEVYSQCKNVVVIDHHRKMVDHIDDAIIFFHEPYASSASEMVAELSQYLGDGKKLPVPVAEALLSGIMLDTKNFTLRTGVRTFEAAAYLRKLGADTVEARKLFSSTIESYQQKTKLVGSAELYKGCALAYAEESGPDIRVVASQAADEMLNINGVDAAFVLFRENDGVSVSARSLGDINVQVVMETLGGGGHLTMAAAQMAGVAMEEGRRQLMEAIDAYHQTMSDKGDKRL